MRPLTEDDYKRFRAKLKVFSDDCWHHGGFEVDGVAISGRRLALLIYKGIDPEDGMYGATCGFSACCNPEHLRRKDGTHGN